MKKTILIASIGFFVFSCSKKMAPAKTETPAPAATPAPEIPAPVPAPTPVAAPANTENAKLNMALINAGQKVFESSCNRCHPLPAPDKYDSQRWVKLVDWMAPKAVLSDEQKTQCLAYVQHNAKDAPKDKSKM